MPFNGAGRGVAAAPPVMLLAARRLTRVQRCHHLPHPLRAPAADLMLFTFVADISILTLNLSLMLNTVSFYQVPRHASGHMGGWAAVELRAPSAGALLAAGCPAWLPAAAPCLSWCCSLSIIVTASCCPPEYPARAAHCPAAPASCTAQIAKLLIIPFVCFIESSFLGRTFTREVLSSIVLVVAGVAVVTGALQTGGCTAVAVMLAVDLMSVVTSQPC